MSNYNENHYLIRLERKLKEGSKRKLLKLMGERAVNHFKKRITKGKDGGGKKFKKRSPEFSNRKGRQTLVKSGSLANSIKVQSISKNTVTIGSKLPYSKIHNEGGKITVTKKMKGFFWIKYREMTEKLRDNKDKQGGNKDTARIKKLTHDANIWKSLALKKEGSKITIPKRKYIGDSPELQKEMEQLTRRFLLDL